MTLLLTILAAVVATVVWYTDSKRKEHKLVALCYMYWGASIMWFVDFVFEYAELKADYFTQAPADILNDSLLGLSVIILALVIWLVIFLVSDPKKVFKGAITSED